MNENKNTYAPAGGTALSLWDIARLLLKKFYWLLLAGVLAAAGVYAVVTLLVTPPYETVSSLKARLEGMYRRVDIGNLKSIAWFACRKAE